MAEEIQYIHQRQKSDGTWIDAQEFIWKLPHEEMATLYGSCCARLKHLEEAEENLNNYHHQEPLKIGGKTQVVEIHSGIPFLKQNFFKNKEGVTGTPKGNKTAQELFANTNQWRTTKDIGLQAITSIGWLMDVTKARAPDITTDTSSTDYSASLLPQNLSIKEEAAPSGYNNNQLNLLKETQKIAAEVLKNCGEKGEKMAEMGTIQFGNLVFKTYSRVWGNLPDPEEIERQRFEKMREQAKAKREEEED
jgi:hypothetical protein